MFCFSFPVFFFFFFFFFQAEDGIRDLYVTGVQTCALPIYSVLQMLRRQRALPAGDVALYVFAPRGAEDSTLLLVARRVVSVVTPHGARSEERRVGKECRSRWSPEQ